MIVGLKESIPYVIKSSPETNIDTNWLKTELLDSLEILSTCGFLVRAIVCENHPAIVSSFKKLLEHVNQNPDELYMLHKSRKTYLCCGTAHLIKNFRNNLLKCKRFLFPPFEFSGFKDPINVPGAEIAWKIFHDVFEKDANPIPSTNLVNYVCTAFAILEFVDDLITKSGLPVRKAAEHALIHCFQSLKTFLCTAHEAIARKITNSTAVKIFNNKRNICTDSVAADGVKTFTKDKGKRVLIKIYCYFYFRHMLYFVIFPKTKYLTRSFIYVHKFGVSQGKNG